MIKNGAWLRASELYSLARQEEAINFWSFTMTRNKARGRKSLPPFGLRSAQSQLLCCPSSPRLWHGLCRFSWHLHPRLLQRGSRGFCHGLLAYKMQDLVSPFNENHFVCGSEFPPVLSEHSRGQSGHSEGPDVRCPIWCPS